MQEEKEKHAIMKDLQDARISDAKHAATLKETNAENARLDAYNVKLQKVIPAIRVSSDCYWSCNLVKNSIATGGCIGESMADDCFRF